MFGASTKKGGVCNAYPDVCKTPAPPSPAPVPIPYPNIAQVSQASKTSKKVKIENKETCTKKTEIGRSSGDEAGSLKGMMSNTNMDKVLRKMGVSKVKVEGAQIVTVMKMTGHNGGNSNAPPGQQTAPSQTKVTVSG